jgi:hypothetical protein
MRASLRVMEHGNLHFPLDYVPVMFYVHPVPQEGAGLRLKPAEERRVFDGEWLV